MEPIDKYKKLKSLLQSRKFWALVMALATTGISVYNGAVSADQGLIAAIGSLAAYMIGTGLDNPAIR